LKQIIADESLTDDQVVLLDTREYKVTTDLPRNQKGSEIIFGARVVAGVEGYPNLGKFDAFMYTDADMTLDMGQVGYLVDEYLTNDKEFSIGSRTHPLSILRKNPTRPGKGVSMYRHITRRLGQTFFEDLNLSDTQCPWKFVSTNLLKQIVPLLDCPDWSIDTDFIGAARHLGHEINVIPITAIDSEKESHGHAIAGGPATRLITIVHGLLRQARKYNLQYDHEIGDLVDRQVQTRADLSAILNTLPPESLRDLPGDAFGKPETMTIQELEQWIIEVKKNYTE
jgi:hypothetical protein